MTLPPNRSPVNRLWRVTHTRRRDLVWRVLAASADEAKRVVLASEPRLDYERLAAEEQRP